MQEQSKDLILSLPAGASLTLNNADIAALENSEPVPAPVSINWDVNAMPKLKGVFDTIKGEYFPSLNPNANEGDKDLVETVFFVALVDGKPQKMHCAAKQFVWKMRQMQDMFPAGTNFPFAAEYLGEEKGKKNFKYQTFSLSFLKPKQA